MYRINYGHGTESKHIQLKSVHQRIREHQNLYSYENVHIENEVYSMEKLQKKFFSNSVIIVSFFNLREVPETDSQEIVDHEIFIIDHQ